MYPVADLEGAELAPPLPLLCVTDWCRHSQYSWYVTSVRYCIMATPSPVYFFKHVKHGTQNVQNNCNIGFLTALGCTKFVFRRGSALDPAWGPYSW